MFQIQFFESSKSHKQIPNLLDPKMTNPQQLEHHISPVIHKIIIYGVMNPQTLSFTRIRDNDIKVGIIRTFEYNSQTKEIQEKSITEEDKYEIWVYPDGIKIYDSNYQIINDPQPQFSFSQPNIIHQLKVLDRIASTQKIQEPLDNIYPFVMTDYDLNRTYCTCLVWNEKRFVENDEQEYVEPKQLAHSIALKPLQPKQRNPNLNSKILPKCTLNELIQDPLILDPSSSLVYIPKGLIICSKHPCINFQKQLLTFLYMNAIKKHDKATIHKKEIDELKNLTIKFGYSQAQKFYDDEEFLTQKQSRWKKEEKEEPIKPYQLHSKKTYERIQREKKESELNLKNLRRLEKRKLEEFYLSVAFLPQLFQSKPETQTLPQIVLMEDTLTESISFFSPYYFASTCFKPPNFNILQTIQRIGLSNLLTLWKNAILQRQILVFSSDQFFTIELFQTLLYLINPFRWQNIYVPFLPFHLCNHVQALGGYFIGMSKIHMDYMIEHFNLQSKVLVDLDQLIIIEQGGTANTQIPVVVKTWMLQQLQLLGFKLNQNKQQGGLLQMLNLSRLVAKQKQPETQIPSSQEQKLKLIFDTHKVFYIALFYLLNDYSPYISQEEKLVKFDRQKYLKIFPDESQKKLNSQIIKTMMFIRLCEFHINAQKQLKWNQADACSLFVYCHYIMKQHRHETESQGVFWSIDYFPSSVLISENDPLKENQSSTQVRQIECAYKLNEYIDFVIKKNVKELTGTKVQSRTYKIQHYLVKYLNYLQFVNPGIVQFSQKVIYEEKQTWFQWFYHMIKRENIEKQQSAKKEKLNQSYEFFSNQKKLLNLKNLFKNVGAKPHEQIKKSFIFEGRNNQKLGIKKGLDRDRVKSAQPLP